MEDILEKKEQVESLSNKINKLQQQADKEKQFNKQIELDHEIRKLKKELEELMNG